MGPTGGHSFLDVLALRPLVLDAALGTRIIARGLNLGLEEPVSWNLSHPDIVLEIHQRDVQAGADVVLTNTFGANRQWLDRFGIAEELETINRQAVLLAREAAGPDRFVVGSIGPTAASTPPCFEASPADREQANLLACAGVDALLLETNAGRGRPGPRVQALRKLTGLPILYSVYDWQDEVGDLIGSLIDGAVDVIGCNCRNGMAEMIRFAEVVGSIAGPIPLLVKPGAGLPEGAQESPNSFALAVPTLLALNVRLFGGCCGTTEDHIASLRSALDFSNRSL